MKAAIIGAGMSGLTVARTLREAGYEVTVFDKSKGTGGRLASRSHQDGWIDHGAPYFSAEKPFHSFLRKQLPDAALQAWHPQVAGQLHTDERFHSIGAPRNSAVTRGLLRNQRFQPATRIARLKAGPDGWQLYNDGTSRLGNWPLVVVAVPAPQALMLLTDHPLFAKQLKQVRMEPAWVAAIRSDKAIDRWPGVEVFEHPVIRRIVNNSAKPERGTDQVYLVQAQKDWSERFLEEPPDAIGRLLLANFAELAGSEQGLELLFVHRWRYAFTEKPLGQSFLWDRASQLGVCGDWCLGRRVEDAWQSGTDLAERILAEYPVK